MLKKRQIINDTNTIVKHVVIKYYLIYWRKYKNIQNIKRRNNMESDLCYSRNTLIKCYNLWKISSVCCIQFSTNLTNIYCFIYTESKQCMDNRLANEKADIFYKKNIIQKHTQILFGHWLLITIQQKDIKQKIEMKCKYNLLKKYFNEIIIVYNYTQIINRFKLKWNKIKHFDLYLKIFIVWKKQCKYQISLLSKKKEIEINKRINCFKFGI